jgi:DinB superfamily
MALPSNWESLLAEHSNAVNEYVGAAERVPAGAWMLPLAAGKWSPAEVTSHVIEAYRVLRAELAGAAGMRMLGSRLQRLVLRYTVLPRLLTGRGFPSGVRAPRETRPREIVEQPTPALASLRELAEAFARELTAQAAATRIRLTHAYFGPLSAPQGLRLVTVHIRHHARQLSSPTL